MSLLSIVSLAQVICSDFSNFASLDLGFSTSTVYRFFLVFAYCFGNANSVYKMVRKEAFDDYLVFEMLAMLNIFCAVEKLGAKTK